jgi:hypothetical protein
MTETKQDIQTQMDQLDERWAHKVKFRKRLQRFNVLAVLMLIVGGVMAYRSDEELPVLFYDSDPSMMLIFFGALPFFVSPESPLRRPAVKQDQALGEYESKRAELQAKLDALD